MQKGAHISRNNIRLSKREEHILASRARNGDKKARDRLVVAYLDLVQPIAFSFLAHGLSPEDLVQAGRIGLIRAASKFSPSKNNRFKDYAAWWIRRTILQALSEQSRIVRVPESFLEMTYKVRKTQRQLEQQKKRPVSVGEMVEETGFTRQDIEDALAVEDWHVSLDTSVNEEGDSLHEIIEDENAEPSDLRALRGEELEKISSALEELSDREAQIIKLHYGLAGERPHTFAEAAEKMSVSHQRVKKLEKSAFSKLKERVLPHTFQ